MLRQQQIPLTGTPDHVLGVPRAVKNVQCQDENAFQAVRGEKGIGYQPLTPLDENHNIEKRWVPYISLLAQQT